MSKLASLCILAYKRPDLLKNCLESLHKTIDYPAEIIVNVDGGDGWSAGYLTELLAQGKISKLIINAGQNRGVGRSFQSCLGVAEGAYIFKVDADLTFYPQWLSTMVDILDKNTDIGAVSCFDYNKWDPNDSRFKPEENIVQERDCCYIVKDFVSSIYAFRADDSYLIFPTQDDGNHTKLTKSGTMKLALTKESMVNNTAFGVHKSTYVSGTEDHPVKTPTFNKPLIFHKED